MDNRYSGFLFDKRFAMIQQVIWIPTILYGSIFLLAYVLKTPSYCKSKE